MSVSVLKQIITDLSGVVVWYAELDLSVF